MALHRAGILHRDIKPENVLLTQDGGIKLIDFDVAEIRGFQGMEDTAPGTASYRAPELFQDKPADERSDLFALGVTLFAALTGHLPYGEIEPFSHPRFGKPAALTKYRPDLPAWLDAVLARAVAADPSERQEDVYGLIEALETGPTQAMPSEKRALPLIQRNPVMFWKVASAIFFLLWLGALLVNFR
jgi:serine/threonine protein kinase